MSNNSVSKEQEEENFSGIRSKKRKIEEISNSE